MSRGSKRRQVSTRDGRKIKATQNSVKRRHRKFARRGDLDTNRRASTVEINDQPGFYPGGTIAFVAGPPRQVKVCCKRSAVSIRHFEDDPAPPNYIRPQTSRAVKHPSQIDFRESPILHPFEEMGAELKLPIPPRR